MCQPERNKDQRRFTFLTKVFSPPGNIIKIYLFLHFGSQTKMFYPFESNSRVLRFFVFVRIDSLTDCIRKQKSLI